MRDAIPAFRYRRSLPVLALFLLILPACGGGDGGTDPLPTGEYSNTIQPIFNRSCIASCHSPGNTEDESELDLTTWDALILGSKNGEILIPFRPDQSHLIDHITGVATPRMPLSRDPLPNSEVDILERWVLDGARNDAGEVPYADLARKIYVANQGSDEISVLSLDGFLVTRIVTVGSDPASIESPHNIWLDGPGDRWYVTLISNPGQLAQYDAENDSLLGTVAVGNSPANGVTTSDGSKVFVTNWDETTGAIGYVTVVDAATMTVVETIQVGGQPHGIAISSDDTRLYTTNYHSDDISVVDLTQDPPVEISRIPVAADVNPLAPRQYLPNEVIPSRDGRFLFVVLNKAGRSDLRVIDLAGDSLYTVIPTGGAGFLADLTPDGTELYVADWNARSVTVINTTTLTRVATITDPYFAFPHGVAFTPDGRYALVTNENQSGAAPAHHPTEGGSPRGNITIIDTQTRQVVKAIDLEPFSAGIAVKF
ncbi:MAG: YncE family protein [bacterium]